jgi:hypothetical protein
VGACTDVNCGEGRVAVLDDLGDKSVLLRLLAEVVGIAERIDLAPGVVDSVLSSAGDIQEAEAEEIRAVNRIPRDVGVRRVRIVDCRVDGQELAGGGVVVAVD